MVQLACLGGEFALEVVGQGATERVIADRWVYQRLRFSVWLPRG